jgi:dihydropteridine reductase
MNSSKFRAIICVAGGWRGGNVADDKFVESCEAMIVQSIYPAVISARVASQFLAE